MLTKSRFLKGNPPFLILILLSSFTPFPVGETSNKNTYYKKRPSYVQCPRELSHLVGVYPLAAELCSVKFSYCAKGEVIRGYCPDKTYFNPGRIDCDEGSGVSKCKDEYKSRLKKVWDVRPLEDDPDYNDCTRRPCNFYPNAEDSGDGSTFVFCDAGATVIRRCRTGHAFDPTTGDCELKNKAKKWVPPKTGTGKKEAENPLDDDTDKKSLGEFKGKPPSSALGLELGNGVSVTQNPTPKKGKDPPADSTWSSWIFCPNATYITKVGTDDCTCTLPQGAESGDTEPDDADNAAVQGPPAKGKSSDGKKGSPAPPASGGKEAHVLPYPAPGVKLPALDCNSKGGGAVNGFKSGSKGVEFICSGAPDQGNEAEYCPATTAACGMSIQYSEQSKKVSNVRLRCCPVRSPLFKPTEELAYVNSFDNSDGEGWRKFEFETGVYGVSSPKQEQSLSAFYASLGFNFNMVLKDLERSLRERTTCLKSKDCIYEWEQFEFKSRDVIKVQKKMMVPPRSRTKLFLVYAQAGYFRINTNRFVEFVENLEYDKKYEEVREVPDSGITLPKNKPGKGDGEDGEGQSPLKAADLDKENPNYKLCPFHNLPPSKRMQREPPDALIIASPIVFDVGDWLQWQNCSKGAYVNRIRQLLHEVKGDKKDKAGVVQLGLGCKALTLSVVGGKTVAKGEESGLEVLEVDFITPGFELQPWKSDAWKGGTCEHGVHVGFQMRTGSKAAKDMVGTEEMRLICSCDKSDLENAPEPGKISNGKSKKKGNDEDTDTALTPNKNSNKIMPKTNGWTEEQICEPLQGLQALVPQQHPMKTDMKKYDNHGLTNVKMKCVDIPNPADQCQTTEKRVLVARCENKEPVKRDCVYNTNIGVGYREGQDVYAMANSLESVGWTLGCIIPNLKSNFQTSMGNSPKYREPIWQPMSPVQGQIQTEPKSKTEIYQIVGECGPYKVNTNRFVKVTNGGNEEEFDLPLPAIDTKAPCWKDFIEMDPVPPYESKAGPEDICKFHDEFSTDNYTKTEGGIIISSPIVTDFGDWDEARGWKHCPPGSYIVGISAKRYQASDADHLGVAHIGFRCVDPNTMSQTQLLSLITPALPGESKDGLKKWFNCSSKGGAAYGFQLYVQPSQGGRHDDVATNNGLLVCSCGETATFEFEEDHHHDEDGHEHIGLWSDPQTCQPKQALCGFTGQFQTFEKPNADNPVDNTGLNNMKAKCCDVDHPGATCKPQTKRVLVGHCDNRNDTRERPCKIKMDVGVSYSPESAGTPRRNFYESIGFVAECAGRVLSKNFAKDSQCKAQREDCEMEWKGRPKQTWMYEDLFTDFAPVPGSKVTPVYQIQGHCGDFVVKTNRYVTNERTKEIPLTDDDIGRGPTCWEDNLPFKADDRNKLKVEPSPVRAPEDPEKPEYNFVEDGAILTSPVEDTTFPEESQEHEWKYCKTPTKDACWYADSLYVERQGNTKDLAGLVAISLQCRNPKLTGDGDHVITGATPGAVIQDDGAKDWKRCDCGTGTGFQVSSVGAQQLGDDLALESFKMMCSCSDPVVKEENDFPKEVQGQRGNWTREQLCRPRQAICGIQARAKQFKAVDSLLKWDNMGITQARIKCCDVPNPAATCEPKQTLREIAICENKDEQQKRRCILDTALGVTYDHDDAGKKNLANFYESIGWGLDCVIPDLQKNFKEHMESKSSDGIAYPWKEPNEKVWHFAAPIQHMIDVKDRTRTAVYQVVGQCGPYLVGTENFVREDTNMRNTDNVMEDSYVHPKPVNHPPVAHCWSDESPISARDYIDPSRKFNNKEYPFHGLPSPGKILLSNLTEEGVEVEHPVAIPKKNSASGAREECFDGGFIVGYAVEKSKVDDDELGAVHLLAKCQKLSNVTQRRRSPWGDDDDDGGSKKAKKAKAKQDEDEDDEGSARKQKGKEELVMKHPGEKFDKTKLTSTYQRCVFGVLVGFQVQMDPVSLKHSSAPATTDDLGIDDIRMMCSVGKNLEPPEPPKKEWKEDTIESCRAYQALCAVSAKFGPKSVGNFKKTDGTGISQLRMACCDVPNPGVGNPPSAKEVSRLASVCNNLQYDQERTCENELEVGVTYDHEENPEESKMHLSVGYSIPCVIRELRKTFQEGHKVHCGRANSCKFDWKKEINSKIFQHGLTSHKNATKVKPYTRQDLYQTVAKLNDLLVLSNEFELVTTDVRGKMIDRNIFTLPLENFPELKEHLVCQHNDKGRKRPKAGDSGNLLPTNTMKPKQKGKGDLPKSNLWPPTEDMKEIDDMNVVQTMKPNNLEGDDDDEVGKAPPQWDDWVNCPQDTFVSYVSPEEGGKGITGFCFKCVNPEDGGLYDNQNVGGGSPSKEKSSKKPGWKPKVVGPVVDGEEGDPKDKSGKKGGKSEPEVSSLSEAKGEKPPKGTAKPDSKDVGCECPGMPLSMVIGVEARTNEKSGVLGGIKPLCPCHKNIPPNATVSDGKATEPLVCRDRQAVCGFQVQRNPKGGEITRMRAACCDVPSPLKDCLPRDKLFRVVVCDNSFVDTESKCNFDLDVGATYDFDNFAEQIKFYEAMNWNLECMSQAIADKFAESLGPGPDTSKNWAKGAKKSPLGPEWDVHADGPHEVSVKPFTKLEIFQALGNCDLYKTYTDRFILTEWNTDTGEIANSAKDLGGPPLTGNSKRNPPTCWMDDQPLVGNSILVNAMKPPFGEDGYHGYVASEKGNKLYSLGDNTHRTGYRLRSKKQTKSSEEDFDDEDDLVGLILCQEETYVKRFSGDPGNDTHFLCATANLTSPNEKSFKDGGVPKGHVYKQRTPAAFIGMVKESSNNDKDPKDIDLTLIPSMPQEWRGGKGGDGKHAEYCHPGQAICGVQGGKKKGTICCTVENPGDICEPKERSVLSATCDNRRDSRKRKCTVKIGVGVTYNFDEHPRSSYFYTSIGYTPECMKTLKKKFQEMPCVKQGKCQYNWGSAPAKLWDRMQAVPQTTDVLPYTKVEYHQKIGVCSFPQGELIITTPVLERKIINTAGKEVKSSEAIVTGENGGFDSKPDECKLKFMDLSEKPPPPPLVDHPPIQLKSLVPVDAEAIPKCNFHGVPQSDLFEYFTNETGVKDHSVVLMGPKDADLDLNLKPKWQAWQECSGEGYVKQMEAYISTLSKGGEKTDSLALNQMILKCVNKNDKPTNEIQLFTESGMAKPKDRKPKPCQDGAVSVGYGVQLRGYQGPLGDDNAFINFKQLCSCGAHGLNDFSAEVADKDHHTGEWEATQVCKPRQAICGYNHQHSQLQVVSSDKTSESFLLHDNLGISGLVAKCCHVPSPAAECEPEEEKALIATCDNQATKRGHRFCDVEVDVGLSYIFQKDGVNMSDFYESIGWNLECQKEEILDKFTKKIGDSKVLKEFAWNSTKGSKVWNRAASGKLSIPLTPKAVHAVYQLIGKCGIYRIHTNVFFVTDSRNNTAGAKQMSDIGNGSPEPCWADLSPLVGRSWLAKYRYTVVPNFEIYVKVKEDKVLPWIVEDKSGRKGCKIQTPKPALPAFKWDDPHICPNNSYMRSFSVRRAMNKPAEYMQTGVDVYGIVSVAYHCMYPNMSIAEEKVYVWRPFEKGTEEKRKENEQNEKHNSPGGRYQYCLGAAMGIEVESAPESNVLKDNYGILDARFMCKTLGKDSDYAHKIDLIGIQLNSPVIHGNAVCKAKQALCSFQGAFTKGIDKTTDSAAMTNIKIGCCNVPSPVATGTPETTLVLAATCDNLVYNRKRKCQYSLGIGIQYDVRAQKEASYFYMSVGFTPTCIAEDIKGKFPQLMNSPPQVFQELSEMKLTIDAEPKTKIDIYQLVGRLNEVLVQTNIVQHVVTNRKMKELERTNITEKNNLPPMKNKPCEVDGLDMDPSNIEMGKPEKIANNEKPAPDEDECVFKERPDFSNYVLKTDLSNYVEGVRELNLERNHKTTWNAYSWVSCKDEAFVTGYDIKTGEIIVPDGLKNSSAMENDTFGIGGMAMQCEGLTDKSKGKSVVHHVFKGSDIAVADFTGNGEKLNEGAFCKDGVAVGFAQQVQPFKKSLDDDALIDFRTLECSKKIHCSCGDTAWKNCEEEPEKDTKKKKDDKKNKADDKKEKKKMKKKDSRWTDSRYCRPREAICGFSIMATQKGEESIRKYDNLGITNFRAKCCPVDTPAFQCTPTEKLALIGECNNTEGAGRKACKIDLYVGLTYDRNSDKNPRLAIKIYDGVGWGLSCVKEDLAESFSHSIKSSKKLFNWKEKMDAKLWNQINKKAHLITADPGTKTSMYQVIGNCGLYKVYTGKFVEKQEDPNGVISSESEHDLDQEIGSDRWESPCWEDTTPIRGRDFMNSMISQPITCPLRTKHKSSKEDQLVLSDKEKEKKDAREGYVISTPHPEMHVREWSEWKFCPEGTFVRGWASVAAGMAYIKDPKKDDYSGVVFIKAICQTADLDPAKDFSISLLQPENEWDEGNWTKLGTYGPMYCVGAGIGIQGIVRTKIKVTGKEDGKNSIAPDKFFFHDTKLVCSCGADAGFMREGRTPVDEKHTKRDKMSEEQPVEACKPRHAVCGIKVSWGRINVGDYLVQDGFGVSNLRATCCEVPSPLTACKKPEEKLVFAMACDNSRGSVPRRCIYNLAVGVAYNFEEFEAESFFYRTNGFTPACIGPEVKKKFTAHKPKACAEKGCKYAWNDAPSRLWQESSTVTLSQDVEPKDRFRIYQVVAQCHNVMVLTNKFVKVIADPKGEEISKETWTMDELPPVKTKHCEF